MVTRMRGYQRGEVSWGGLGGRGAVGVGGCVCVWNSVTKKTQGFCNNLAHQLIERAKISSMARGHIIQLGPTKLCMM